MTQAIDIKSRRRSLLAERGDEAREAAQRELLRETLIAKGWHLTGTVARMSPCPCSVMCGGTRARRRIFTAPVIAHGRRMPRPF